VLVLPFFKNWNSVDFKDYNTIRFPDETLCDFLGFFVY
jgi:hypothetical protein